jgi:hypothetical protein
MKLPKGIVWPNMFRPLLERYGQTAVWLAGLEALGYPPTWAQTQREFRKVADFFRK